jgi:RNA:NAD 2'-phosphotransferase (TPT1/KptA family)
MSFRLLGRIPQRPCILYQKYDFQRTYPYSTIFSPPKRRQIDYKALEKLKKTLLYVLRTAAGREHGFGNTDDGYISVKRLVSLSSFCS